MNATYYTIEDWSIANFIMRTHQDDSLDHRLVDISWARQVQAYFRTYIRIARIYCRHYLGSWGESIRHLWSRIRSFRSVRDMDDLHREVRQQLARDTCSRTEAVWCRAVGRDYGQRGELHEFRHVAMRSRASQHRRAAGVRAICDRLDLAFSRGRS